MLISSLFFCLYGKVYHMVNYIIDNQIFKTVVFVLLTT
jgi:hypothetical protein